MHCSASDHDEDIQIVRQWHLKRGFRDIGYHFYIRKNGEIQLGRPIEIIGAHCEGENSDSIGVCLAGDQYFTREQFSTAKKLNHMLLVLFNCSFHPHSEYSKEGKTCPNFDIKLVLPDRNLFLVN